MKVLFPRNIKKWFFSGLNFTIWPLTVNIVQLFVMAIGVASSFAVANYLMKAWNPRFFAIAAASPFTLIAAAIAFFNISEMGLLEFWAKLARNNFFDITTKYQVNTQKFHPIELIIQKNNKQEQVKKIVFKSRKDLFTEDMKNSIKESWLL